MNTCCLSKKDFLIEEESYTDRELLENPAGSFTKGYFLMDFCLGQATSANRGFSSTREKLRILKSTGWEQKFYFRKICGTRENFTMICTMDRASSSTSRAKS